LPKNSDEKEIPEEKEQELRSKARTPEENVSYAQSIISLGGSLHRRLPLGTKAWKPRGGVARKGRVSGDRKRSKGEHHLSKKPLLTTGSRKQYNFYLRLTKKRGTKIIVKEGRMD